jgi:transcriptional regulator with XRE-family HTH domain
MSKHKNSEVHPVDSHVGMRLRKKRQELGISQEELANSVDLTFQQIQKYEKGLNRISCSKLHDFSKFLKTDVRYFFQGFEDYNYSSGEEAMVFQENSSQTNYRHSDVYTEITELVKAFQTLKDYRVRRSIINLAQSLTTQASKE